jgi:hypothetical protein
MAATKSPWVYLVIVLAHVPGFYFLLQMFNHGLYNTIGFYALLLSLCANCIEFATSTRNPLLTQPTSLLDYVLIGSIVLEIACILRSSVFFSDLAFTIGVLLLLILLCMFCRLAFASSSRVHVVVTRGLCDAAFFLLAGIYTFLYYFYQDIMIPREYFYLDHTPYITLVWWGVFALIGGIIGVLAFHPTPVVELWESIDENWDVSERILYRIQPKDLGVEQFDKKEGKVLYLAIQTPTTIEKTFMTDICKEFDKHGDARATFFINHTELLLNRNIAAITHVLKKQHDIGIDMQDTSLEQTCCNIETLKQILQERFKITSGFIRASEFSKQKDTMRLLAIKGLRQIAESIWPWSVWHCKLWFKFSYYTEFGRPIVVVSTNTVNMMREMLPWWKAQGWKIKSLPPNLVSSISVETK